MSAEPVDAATAKEMVDSGAQILDVRIDGEARLDGIIAGAEVLPSHTWEHGFFLPRDEFVAEVAAQFSKAEPLLVCCADGMRSKSASTQLADAGFEFTDDHNFQEAVYFDLGNDEQSFKVAALPIWDTLAEMEASGSMPDAWAKAQSAFPEAAKPFIDDSGNISLKAEFRISVARKPAA